MYLKEGRRRFFIVLLSLCLKEHSNRKRGRVLPSFILTTSVPALCQVRNCTTMSGQQNSLLCRAVRRTLLPSPSLTAASRQLLGRQPEEVQLCRGLGLGLVSLHPLHFISTLFSKEGDVDQHRRSRVCWPTVNCSPLARP